MTASRLPIGYRTLLTALDAKHRRRLEDRFRASPRCAGQCGDLYRHHHTRHDAARRHRYSTADVHRQQHFHGDVGGYDAASGLDTFDLQMRAGSIGAWSDILNVHHAHPRITLSGLRGQTYFFRAPRARYVATWARMRPVMATRTLRSIWLPPNGQMVIDNAAVFANTISVTVNVSVTDLSGVAALQLSNDDLTYTDWAELRRQYAVDAGRRRRSQNRTRTYARSSRARLRSDRWRDHSGLHAAAGQPCNQ